MIKAFTWMKEKSTLHHLWLGPIGSVFISKGVEEINLQSHCLVFKNISVTSDWIHSTLYSEIRDCLQKLFRNSFFKMLYSQPCTVHILNCWSPAPGSHGVKNKMAKKTHKKKQVVGSWCWLVGLILSSNESKYTQVVLKKNKFPDPGFLHPFPFLHPLKQMESPTPIVLYFSFLVWFVEAQIYLKYRW